MPLHTSLLHTFTTRDPVRHRAEFSTGWGFGRQTAPVAWM